MILKMKMEKENKRCKNPNCDNKVHNIYAGYCQKCSIRGNARNNGYELIEDIELDMGNNKVGYILKLKS